MKVETTFIQGEYLKHDNSEGSDENFEDYGELEIDLDYNDNDISTKQCRYEGTEVFHNRPRKYSCKCKCIGNSGSSF